MLLIGLGVALLVVGVVLYFVRQRERRALLDFRITSPSTVGALADFARQVDDDLAGMGQAPGFRQIAAVTGTVRCDAPLTSEVGHQPCVYYSMQVTREYEESYYEKDPKTNEREQKTRRGSDSVAQNSQRTDFWIEDATGRLRVNPNDAQFDAVQTVDRFEPAPAGLAGGAISFGGFTVSVGTDASGTRTLGYRFREHALPVDRRVYAFGEATTVPGELTIQKPTEAGKRFLITLKSQEELVSATESTVRWLLIGAIASGLAGVAAIAVGILNR